MLRTFGGKLYGLPQFLGSPAANIVWVRTDWMKQLNLPDPKSMDHLVAIASAFANKDPDKDGKKIRLGWASRFRQMALSAQ